MDNVLKENGEESFSVEKDKNDKRKQRENLFTILGLIYCVFLISLCFALTLYFSFTRVKVDSSIIYEIFYILLYISGSAILIFLMIFLRRTKQISPQNNPEMQTAIINHISYRTHCFTGEGFNVYLLLGLAIFVISSVIYNCLRIAGEFSHLTMCFNVTRVIFSMCQIIYFISQAVFIFMYHKIIFDKYSSKMQFFFIHLFSVNICTWVHSAIGEIVEGVAAEQHSMASSKSNSTEKPHVDVCLIDSVTDSARPFLIPMIIEYALLTGPMMLEIMLRRPHVHSEHSHQDESSDEDEDEHYPTLHKSKRGLIFASVVTAISITAIAIFYLVHNFFAGAFVYHVIDIFLNVVGIVLSIFCMKYLNNFRYVKTEKGTFDDKILILCLIGAFIYCVVSITSGIDVLRSSSKKFSTEILAGLKLTAQLITTVQCALQTVMLLDGSRRRAATGSHVVAKPGRPHLVTLLGINLALWLFDAFEVLKVNVHYTSEYLDFDGSLDSLTWTILIHTTLPLMIFFRYHSTAMLSIIWYKAYEK